jgi:hypothetical protein
MRFGNTYHVDDAASVSDVIAGSVKGWIWEELFEDYDVIASNAS